MVGTINILRSRQIFESCECPFKITLGFFVQKQKEKPGMKYTFFLNFAFPKGNFKYTD